MEIIEIEIFFIVVINVVVVFVIMSNQTTYTRVV